MTRTRLRQQTAVFLILLGSASCDPALVAQLDLVTASDLAGTYTGVLEGVSVGTLDDLEDPYSIVARMQAPDTGQLKSRTQGAKLRGTPFSRRSPCCVRFRWS